MKRKELLDKVLPRAVSEQIDHLFRARRLWQPAGSPMNGMTARLEITRSILEKCSIRRVIETGTFLAATTKWFAEFGIPVESAELNPHFAAAARRRLRRSPHVTIHTGNSTDVLRTIIDRGPDFSERVFFYLDAHWHDYLPLRDEVELVLKHYREPVILIDDFQVPHDPGYGFDDYGAGKRICVEYIAPALTSDARVFLPSTSALFETGHRRGFAVIARSPATIAALQQQPLLQPHTPTAAQRRAA